MLGNTISQTGAIQPVNITTLRGAFRELSRRELLAPPASRTAPGLPEGVTPKDVIAVAKDYARLPDKTNATERDYLDIILRLSGGVKAANDWTNGPVGAGCFASTETMEERSGLKERSRQMVERSLAAKGFIARRDAGNSNRWGKRCEKTGLLLDFCGLSLLPMVENYETWKREIEAHRANKAAAKKARKSLVTVRRSVQGRVAQGAKHFPDAADWSALAATATALCADAERVGDDKEATAEEIEEVIVALNRFDAHVHSLIAVDEQPAAEDVEIEAEASAAVEAEETATPVVRTVSITEKPMTKALSAPKAGKRRWNNWRQHKAPMHVGMRFPQPKAVALSREQEEGRTGFLTVWLVHTSQTLQDACTAVGIDPRTATNDDCLVPALRRILADWKVPAAAYEADYLSGEGLSRLVAAVWLTARKRDEEITSSRGGLLRRLIDRMNTAADEGVVFDWVDFQKKVYVASAQATALRLGTTDQVTPCLPDAWAEIPAAVEQPVVEAVAAREAAQVEEVIAVDHAAVIEDALQALAAGADRDEIQGVIAGAVAAQRRNRGQRASAEDVAADLTGNLMMLSILHAAWQRGDHERVEEIASELGDDIAVLAARMLPSEGVLSWADVPAFVAAVEAAKAGRSIPPARRPLDVLTRNFVRQAVPAHNPRAAAVRARLEWGSDDDEGCWIN
ncbi:helix-turn-helix domain-containing protein [Azospirillum argentinense]|uniref:Plasmid replication protein C N-terminal domain-containing protein n=1 Tax=Azospirillum brasilense TaxID=192 RepID=A0A4D8QQ60_AZOBR|nr:helix-turn-helix domain-containing protein [Azospirillum argentinense]QCO07442.1 hypothetical protein D3867_36780 [Azospirillum argentinense]